MRTLDNRLARGDCLLDWALICVQHAVPVSAAYHWRIKNDPPLLNLRLAVLLSFVLLASWVPHAVSPALQDALALAVTHLQFTFTIPRSKRACLFANRRCHGLHSTQLHNFSHSYSSLPYLHSHLHATMVYSKALVEAFSIDISTRELIAARNLKTGSAAIKPIRQALGFREVGEPGSSVPKFASTVVHALYSSLDGLAKKCLPMDSLEGLQQAWRRGELLQTELDQLLNQYGDEIWGLPVAQRHLAPRSSLHLLVAGEGDGFYKTDLSYAIQQHRE